MLLESIAVFCAVLSLRESKAAKKAFQNLGGMIDGFFNYNDRPEVKDEKGRPIINITPEVRRYDSISPSISARSTIQKVDLSCELPVETGQDSYEIGTRLYSEGKLLEAIPYLEQALNAHPAIEGAIIRLIFCYRDVGLLDKALKWAEKLLEVNPSVENGFALLADLWRAKGNYRVSAEYFYKAIEDKPTAFLYWKLAQTLRDQGGANEKALAAAFQAIELDKTLTEPYALISAVYIEEGKLSEAASVMLEALDKVTTPESKKALLISLASIYSDMKAYADAIKSVDAYLELPGENGLGLVYKVYSLLGQKNYTEARVTLNQAGTSISSTPMYLVVAGYVELGMGNVQEARDFFLKAKDKAPDLAEVYHGLALSAKALGRLGEAQLAEEQAVRLKGKAKEFIEFDQVKFEPVSDQYGLYNITVPRYRGGQISLLHIAEHQDSKERVIIKELNNYFASQSEFVAGMQAEVKLLREISHPNVMPVLLDAVHPQKNRYYLVLPYYSYNLSEWLERHWPLTAEQVLNIARQILMALEYLHTVKLKEQPDLHIVHRDLKPTHILLEDENRVVVADFFQAKITNTFVTQTGRTQSRVNGDIYYSSPERLMGQKVDSRTDLYSAGAIIYEMVTGKAPFGGDNDDFIQMAKRIVKEPVKLPSEFDEEYACWDEWLSRALAKDRNQRFRTANEMLAALPDEKNSK